MGGPPWPPSVYKLTAESERRPYLEFVFQPRAATEGCPYSYPKPPSTSQRAQGQFVFFVLLCG